MWDGVQGHMPVDVGVQVQSGVRGLLRAQELVAGRKGSGRHGRQRQSRGFLLTDVALTSVRSLFGLKERSTCLLTETGTGTGQKRLPSRCTAGTGSS